MCSDPSPRPLHPPAAPADAHVLPDSLAIRAAGVGKAYDLDVSALRRLARAIVPAAGGRSGGIEPFWALRGVEFDLPRGESLGIIGRNGSGKSTLLQIIAGTLRPTEGTVLVRGRVAALLELGSGFNPHFTGRENVYLAGSIIGIGRSEMDERFEEIAAFADIGAFIDRPLSTYSSGMHARLAFAVASSVRPNILILDEILSVGDAGFQQRCIGRLKRLLDSGVTLLFVSHAADAVKSICRSVLYLAGGRVQFFGPAARGVDVYLSDLRHATTARALERLPGLATQRPALAGPSAAAGLRHGTGHGRITGVRLLTTAGAPAEAFSLGETVRVEISVESHASLRRLDLALAVRDAAGIEIFGATARDAHARIPPMNAGERCTVAFEFRNILRPGAHGLCVTFIRRPNRRGDGLVTLDHLDGCAAFESISDGKRTVRGKVLNRVRAAVVIDQPSGAAPPAGRS